MNSKTSPRRPWIRCRPCPRSAAGRAALATSQDRLVEKDFLTHLGLRTAPYAAVDDISDLRTAAAKLGTPCILKTRRFGYDGKGQVRVTDGDDLTAIWGRMEGAPCVLESFIPLHHGNQRDCGAGDGRPNRLL